MRIRLIVISLFLSVCLAAVGVSIGQKGTALVAGEWLISIAFSRGTDQHTAFIDQKGDSLYGKMKARVTEGTINGIVRGDSVYFRSNHKIQATHFHYQYIGTIKGDAMSGTIDMGWYKTAEWTARRKK